MSGRQSKRALHTGSAEWRRLRAKVLLRDGYICRRCRGIADQVDHKDNDSHNNALANLWSLCHQCHSAKTAREMAGKPQPLTFNAMGEPI